MLKRLFDVSLSGVGLLVSSPLWAVIAATIKLEDGGSVFFTQDRVGYRGRIFRAYKFRSMKMNAATNVQAGEDDPRITRIGKLLRATAMDELPQLLNIFKGDMSFVGPRALLATEMEVQTPLPNGRKRSSRENHELDRLFSKRCTVIPGLTGVAQIFAPRDVPRRKKFRYDLIYIKRSSFAFDLKLILLSFWITFRGKWETRDNKLSAGTPKSAFPNEGSQIAHTTETSASHSPGVSAHQATNA